jgi:formylglycine-generating enzyme
MQIRTLVKIAGLLGVAVLTGCPYTEGCEALPVTADGGPIDDGGPGDDVVEPPDEDVREEDTSVPLGPILPNCQGLTATCGGESCCAAQNVPGGTFNRLNNAAYPATVSTFRLDTYEVVVGRFRAFVNAGKGTKKSPPEVGSGANPNVPNSGWQASFNALLTDDRDGIVNVLPCDPTLYNVWSEVPGTNDNLPMNCVTWVEAFAFCIWDGGRLPTETEWNYAAAGGAEQRVYPWGNAPAIDQTRVNYGCQSGTSVADPGAPPCTFANYLAAGSKPLGKGRWGHADMAGNVWERVLDSFADPFRITPCNNCADLQETPEGRGIRGGSFNWGQDYQRTNDRTAAVNNEPDNNRTNTVGFRCARAAQ